MNEDFKIDVIYGFKRLETVWRTLPNGMSEAGCRVRTYDNKPGEPEHLVSDKTEWGGIQIGFQDPPTEKKWWRFW